MKHLFLFLLFLPVLSRAQKLNTTLRSGPGNIYNDAISRYIEYRYGAGERHDTFFLFKQKDVAIPPLSDSFARVIKGRILVALEISDVDSLVSRRKAMIHIIRPLEFHKGQFYVMIIPYNARQFEGRKRLSTWGGIAVFYTYSKRRKAFRFRKVASYEI